MAYDGIKYYIYKDGALIVSANANQTNIEANMNTLYLFGGTANNYSLCSLNDVRIYDHCLSAAEVHEISQGLVLHYKLDSFQGGYGNPNLITGYDTSFLSYNDGAVTLFTNQMNGGAQEIVSNIPGASKCLHLHSSGGSNRQYRTIAATSGKSYTISVDYYSTSNQNIALHCELNGGNYSWTQANGLAYTTPGKWIRLSATYTNLTSNATLYYFIYCVNGTDCYVKNFKIEEGTSATNWVPNGVTSTIIQDSSGYGHNGTVNGTLTLSDNTARYSICGYFGAYNTPNIIVNDISSFVPALSNCTVTWWGKYDTTKTLLFTGQTTSYYIAASDNNTYYHGTVGSNTKTFYKDGVAGSYKCAADGWHFFAITGLDLSTWTALKLNSYNSSWPLKGYINDLRIYSTILSVDDIKQLYNTAAKIDNLGGLHTFELNENGSNKLTKTGIFKDYMVEPFMTLADGSKWQLLMFHYVDNGTNLFTSSNAAYCNDFGLYSRLQYIDNFTYDSKYEFYAIQDGTTHRWTQTNAPLSTTAVAGFTSISGSPGGGICKCSGNTLLAASNSTGNWWRACGCWTLFGGNGIPGFNGGTCRQYLALYARISEPKFHIANLSAYATNLIEK